MNTPRKGLSFDSFVGQKMQQKKQELGRKHAIIAKRQNDAVRRHLTFNNGSSDGSSAENKTPAKKKKQKRNKTEKYTPPGKCSSNDSGIFSTPPMSPIEPALNHRFRQLSPPKTDVSSEDSDNSLLDLPAEPTPKQRRKLMKRALADLGINQNRDGEKKPRKNVKRKQKSTDDEPQKKISATPQRGRKPRKDDKQAQEKEVVLQSDDHQKAMDSIDNNEEGYQLNIVFEEPLDGRAWSGDAPKEPQDTKQSSVDLDRLMMREEWLKKLGITSDTEMITDISDISSSEEEAM